MLSDALRMKHRVITVEERLATFELDNDLMKKILKEHNDELKQLTG